MELQKEAFTGLMEYYKKLPLESKRSEVVNELENIISTFSKICSKLGVMPDMLLNKEMLNINKSNITEDEFLPAIFAYINTIDDISAQLINKVCDILEKSENIF